MALLPFQAGLHACDPQRQGFLNLALGESPYGMSPKAKQTLIAASHGAFPYPDSSCGALAEKIGAHYGVSPEKVLVGNGIDELILISALTFLKPQDVCLLNRSTFSGFEAAAERMGANILYAPLEDATLKVDAGFLRFHLDQKPRLWFLCNPHNPTGTVIEWSKLLEKAAQNNVIAVIDEAYGEYAKDFTSAIDWVSRHPNVIVMRTFSKIYGLAGLRCGYAIGDRALIGEMKKIRHVLPFSVNRLALDVAQAALEDQAFVQSCFQKTEEAKQFFYSQLRKFGLSFIPSSTNFVFVAFQQETDRICQEMKEKYRILIRSGTPFGLPHHIRVTVGTLHQMERMSEALGKILQEEGYGPVRSTF